MRRVASRTGALLQLLVFPECLQDINPPLIEEVFTISIIKTGKCFLPILGIPEFGNISGWIV
jgi:hypothetical protein